MTMKKFALLTIAALALTACNDVKDNPVGPVAPDGTGTGAIRLALSPENDITVVEAKSNESVNVNNFEVDILDEKGASYAKYASYELVPSEVALPVGTYSISATSGRLKSAAFDEPHYAGTKSFAVEVGKTVDVGISCVITNVKVTVEYSAKILETLTDIEAKVSSAYDAADNSKIGRLTFNPTETRAGWFAKPHDKQITVYVTGKNKQTGVPVTTSTILANVDSRQWRKVALDIKTSGGVDVEISIDDQIKEFPPIDVTIPDTEDVIDNNGDNGNWEEGGDEPENPGEPTDNKPTIVGAAYGNEESNAPFNVDEEILFNVANDNVLDVLMTSKAADGISNLFLTIESDALVDVLGPVLGITGEIDLANPEVGSTWADMFASSDIGLLDPEQPIKGKISHTFSVGKLMSLLGSLPGGVGSPHLFKLRLVDANGETAKTLAITLE